MNDWFKRFRDWWVSPTCRSNEPVPPPHAPKTDSTAYKPTIDMMDAVMSSMASTKISPLTEEQQKVLFEIAAKYRYRGIRECSKSEIAQAVNFMHRVDITTPAILIPEPDNVIADKPEEPTVYLKLDELHNEIIRRLWSDASNHCQCYGCKSLRAELIAEIDRNKNEIHYLRHHNNF